MGDGGWRIVGWVFFRYIRDVGHVSLIKSSFGLVIAWDFLGIMGIIHGDGCDPRRDCGLMLGVASSILRSLVAVSVSFSLEVVTAVWANEAG